VAGRSFCGGIIAGHLVRNIIATGKNYRKHILEMGHPIPDAPSFFLKPTSSILDDGATILLPPESTRVDHEVELAIFVGKRGHRITVKDAPKHIAGYGVAVDVSARDIQIADMKQGNPWTVSKGFDTFCPLSVMRPAGALKVNADDTRLWLSVNGKVRQDNRTSDMIWKCGELVSRISQFMTIDLGDVILTGTPEGVGPMVDGDKVECAVEGIGELHLTCKVEKVK
jgi:2-keto-4-pentenoate hydratase/2-oxohepta-3-ene-1,7-dioic acid hydratase in catechol pathway